MENMHENPVDLRRRMLARTLEEEIGGIFNVDWRDIEKAIERLDDRISGGDSASLEGKDRFPAPLRRALVHLNAVLELARESARSGEMESLEHIKALFRDHLAKIEGLGSEKGRERS